MTAAQAEHARSPKVSHLVSLARRGAHEVALSAWAVVRWLWRHTRWVFLVTSLAFVVALLAGQDVGLMAVVFGWVVPAVGLSLWQRHRPMSYEKRVAGPLRRRRYRKWAHGAWHAVAGGCGLGVTHTVNRRNLKGERWTEKVTRVPALKSVQATDTALFITARALVGQTSDDLAAIAPAVGDAAAAQSSRARIVGPGMVRFELRMREHLAEAITAQVPVPPESGKVWIDYVDAGRREDGSDWWLRLVERHTLVTGCAGSGKGSMVWGVACNLAPAVAGGLVRLYGIDLKYGVELSMGRRLFSALATNEEQALRMLERLDDLVRERGDAMAGKSRSHVASLDAPFVVLIIDELASLTAYMSDAAAKKEADRLLRSILSKGRAMGVVVIGAIQDPRKEAIPARGLFTQTVALRLRSASETTMVLGEGMADVAPAHRISDVQPGTAYVIDEDGSASKVRAAYWPDSVIRATAQRYPTPHVESLDPAPEATETGPTDAPTSEAKRDAERKPRKPRSPRKPRDTGEESAA